MAYRYKPRTTKKKTLAFFFRRFWVEEAPSFRNRFRRKKVYLYRSFWVKEPRHSETISAKKRYTSIAAFIDIINRLRKPRHSETISAKKRYTSIAAFIDNHYL